MKLVALVRAPTQPEPAARALAAASGLTMAEARMRLAPEPPALLARLEDGEADVLVASLRNARLAALAINTVVPTDRDRTRVHSLSLGQASITLSPRSGDSMVVDRAEVLTILRGARSSRLDIERTEKTLRPAAVGTGGLWVTRHVGPKVRSSEETLEQVILVYARDGRSAVLAETDFDFSCLGAQKQPTSTGNMATLAKLLRDPASGAFYDERLLRLGRRPLPFLAPAEAHARTAAVAVTRTDMSGSLDVLAEMLHQAVRAALLP